MPLNKEIKLTVCTWVREFSPMLSAKDDISVSICGTSPLAEGLECSPLVKETGVQSQVEFDSSLFNIQH